MKGQAMDERETTILQLRNLVAQFVRERDWERFHTPKNLASSIAIETAELMEHFQWLSAEESQALRGQALDSPIAQEMADVLAYLLSLATVLEVDLAAALESKMERNRRKYPAPSPPTG
ncbi:MAG: nucleotide pyrophosphohydrolase [Pirellulaceae bacterium]